MTQLQALGMLDWEVLEERVQAKNLCPWYKDNETGCQFWALRTRRP